MGYTLSRLIGWLYKGPLKCKNNSLPLFSFNIRLRRKEKLEEWLTQLATKSPRSQKLARPQFTPVPVKRLFSHRAMVEATRAKYSQLPEVVSSRLDFIKSRKYKTNRLQAQIYSCRLRKKAIKGKVSHTHHHNVIS